MPWMERPIAPSARTSASVSATRRGSGAVTRSGIVPSLVSSAPTARTRLVGGGGERAHELVEGALHVEEERVQVRPPRPDPGERDPARTAAERGEAERILQAVRGVDGQHGRPPPAARRLERERGSGGRLADPAAPHAEDDAPALERVGERAHAARPAARASSAASAATPAGASGAPKRKGRRTGAAPSARRSAVSWASACRRRSRWKRAARR